MVYLAGCSLLLILIFFVSYQLWDINMDAGPVATFQVHEHLRPKVKCLTVRDCLFRINGLVCVFITRGKVLYDCSPFSYVIYMKMTQSLTNLSVA